MTNKKGYGDTFWNIPSPVPCTECSSFCTIGEAIVSRDMFGYAICASCVDRLHGSTVDEV